ncbi:MAG: glucose-6-phosphate isomerase [Candidatus Marinimicrobia bacterium]|nr:glucose-6-phosphate isomerase [Candidatus Neomarinimicrobiota bacterium]
MSGSTDWNKFHHNLYINSELDLYLDLSDTGVSRTDFQSHDRKIQAALSEMDALEKGAIANPDEDRQVGHYWLRNPELSPTPEIRRLIEDTVRDIKIFAFDIINGRLRNPAGLTFTHLLLIGIGGSALGPQFICEALGSQKGLKIHFLDNTDPDGIDRTLDQLAPSLSQTLVIVISKSGGTAETRNGMLETQSMFKKNKLDFAKQAIAITGEGSQLHNLAKTEQWISIFPMWDWVGGRTSVMSAVGLLPAALMNIDIETLLAGARSMDDATRTKELMKNPAALLALSWFIIGKGHGTKDMVVLPYKDRLLLFSRYLQQLIMESIGKSHDLDGKLVQQGIAVYGNKGSTDQHAYVQQLRDGLDNFFVTFIEVLSDRQGKSILVDNQNTSGDYLFGFYKGTQTALRENNRPSITITIPDLSAASIAALIALYERAVGIYASLVNINAYHQPGVEAGKKAAGVVLETKNRVLGLLANTDQSLSIKEICHQLDLEGKEILIYQILRHYAANNPLIVDGSFHDPANLSVSRSN